MSWDQLGPILIEKGLLGVLLLIFGLWINRSLEKYKASLDEKSGIRERIAEARLPAYKKLWAITQLTDPHRKQPIKTSDKQKLITELNDWYYHDGQGIFLDEDTRRLYDLAMSSLHSDQANMLTEDAINNTFESLRLAIKNGIGIYGKISIANLKLMEDYKLHVKIYPKHSIDTEFIQLKSDGTLIIKNGYAWRVIDIDINCSGTVLAGLVRDVLNQLVTDRQIKYETCEDEDSKYKNYLEESKKPDPRERQLDSSIRELREPSYERL